MGFHKTDLGGIADLILISELDEFEPIMKKIDTKTFFCKDGVDFATAAGLQVNRMGQLHIWGTQRDAVEEIVINKFSQQ